MKIKFSGLLKQYNIDNGQLGGTLKMFLETQFLFAVLSFVGVMRLWYLTDFKDKISIPLFVLIIGIGYGIIVYIYFTVLYPSQTKFANRQIATHGNPMMERLDEIKGDIEKIKKQMEEKYEIQK